MRAGGEPFEPAAARMEADPEAGFPRVVVTPRARWAVERITRAGGPHVVLLSWPDGATCLPAASFRPSAFHVVIGYVAGCPVHADTRQLRYFEDGSALIDTSPSTRRASSLFVLRPVFDAPP